jgi:hypothetical protein
MQHEVGFEIIGHVSMRRRSPPLQGSLQVRMMTVQA